MSKTALFPGSFDPITRGHMDVILKALGLFDRVIIGIGSNTSKKAMFPIEQRQAWIRNLFADQPRIEVSVYEGLTVDYALKTGAGFIIRGLRSGLDFEYEQSIAFANKELVPSIETVFLLSGPSYNNISSTIVRDIIANRGDYSRFVPEGVVIG